MSGARPNFQLPFPYGEKWLAQTRADHKPNPNSLDLTRQGGDSNGRPILAAAAGKVVRARYEGGGGNFVRIDHGNGWQTRYLHMIEQPAVSEGQTVTQGQRIGRVGSTGDSGAPHLHFEQMSDGETVRSVFNGEPVQVQIGHSQVLTSYNGGTGPVSTSGVVAADVTGDGHADLLARKPDGSLWLYTNSGTDAPYGSGKVVGAGWQGFMWFAAGPVTGGKRADILAVRPDGALLLYPNTGDDNQPYGSGKVVGSSWHQFNRFMVGDVTGDGRADIVVSRPDGELLLYANTGSADQPYAGAAVIGEGFTIMDRIVVADITGDKRADLLTTNPAGGLFLYANSGSDSAPYSLPATIGDGWGAINRITAGDVTGDGNTDVVATRPDGTLLLYKHSGSATAPYGAGSVIGNGWQVFA
ncbi:peptidoglycan DD-metalloendopeptidase family protein [Paractinoplanes atraurantiacus]|uniref:Repeat domain-containing protein n=1 Tax=Paractinoplanes atraurantiacus TaxID=1036182 RepID=A0A285HPJ1_9ACTN|nr:peptidoglycan DD-metalloendopeptidase family protein [Actinoplanes atraurantiacus]SNY37607.1 Repeat domain-containing protein [Actinoplanes atraurantiacus]